MHYVCNDIAAPRLGEVSEQSEDGGGYPTDLATERQKIYNYGRGAAYKQKATFNSP